MSLLIGFEYKTKNGATAIIYSANPANRHGHIHGAISLDKLYQIEADGVGWEASKWTKDGKHCKEPGFDLDLTVAPQPSVPWFVELAKGDPMTVAAAAGATVLARALRGSDQHSETDPSTGKERV